VGGVVGQAEEVRPMTTYEAVSVMLAFGTFIVLLMTSVIGIVRRKK
jgi:hypothetical protein